MPHHRNSRDIRVHQEIQGERLAHVLRLDPERVPSAGDPRDHRSRTVINDSPETGLRSGPVEDDKLIDDKI